MGFFLLLMVIIIVAAIILANAIILSHAVPALLTDPTNVWAWIGVLIVVALTLGAGRGGTKAVR